MTDILDAHESTGGNSSTAGLSIITTHGKAMVPRRNSQHYKELRNFLWKLSKQTPAAPATGHPVIGIAILLAAVAGLFAGFQLVPNGAGEGTEVFYCVGGCILDGLAGLLLVVGTDKLFKIRNYLVPLGVVVVLGITGAVIFYFELRGRALNSCLFFALMSLLFLTRRFVLQQMNAMKNRR